MINITHLRIKPLALTNGHGLYMAVTPERALASGGECLLHILPLKFCPVHFQNGRVTAVSLLKPPFGGFRSETVIWIQKWFKKSVGTSRKFYL
jgi:hypothetical protein